MFFESAASAARAVLIASVSGSDRYSTPAGDRYCTAGAPVFDLESGKVVGFHFAGQAATEEGPGFKVAIALWMSADHPLFRRLGVRLEE